MSITERTIIDSKNFATGFANAITQRGFNDAEIVKEAKQYLLSYLTAYYLVEDFNDVESQNFSGPVDVTRFKDMSFEELMTRVKELNKY